MIFSFWFTSGNIKAISELNMSLTPYGRMSVAKKKTQVS